MPCKMVVNDVKSAGDARFGIPPRFEVTFHAEILLAVNAYNPNQWEFKMQGKQSFAIQTLVVTLVLNAILLAAIYFVGGAFVTFGMGFLITMLLWFGVQSVGKRFIEEAAAPPETEALPKEPAALPSEASAIQILSILIRKPIP